MGRRQLVAGEKRFGEKFFFKTIVGASAGERAQKRHIARAKGRLRVDRTDAYPVIEIFDEGSDVFWTPMLA